MGGYIMAALISLLEKRGQRRKEVRVAFVVSTRITQSEFHALYLKKKNSFFLGFLCVPLHETPH